MKTMRSSILLPAGLILTLLALTSCGGDPAPDENEDASAPPSFKTPAWGSLPAQLREEAKTYYSNTCKLCHGPEGHGDGPAGAQLKPKPRSYSEPTWLETAKVETIMKVILKGGPAIGKSPLMPPNPQLEGKTELQRALALYVLELGHRGR